MERLLNSSYHTPAVTELQQQLIGNLYAININVNTAQAANVARAVEGRRFHGVPPPKASFVTLHRRNNSSLKTDHGCCLVSTSEAALGCCYLSKLQYVCAACTAFCQALVLCSGRHFVLGRLWRCILPHQYGPYKHQCIALILPVWPL